MEYVQLICALIGIIGLIFLFFWALRKLNKGILTTGGKRLKVLDRASLGGEKSVVVISAAGKCMILGVTAGKISKIDDLDMTEEAYLAQLYPNSDKTENGTQQGFFAAFSDALAKNVRNMRKGGKENAGAAPQLSSEDEPEADGGIDNSREEGK